MAQTFLGISEIERAAADTAAAAAAAAARLFWAEGLFREAEAALCTIRLYERTKLASGCSPKTLGPSPSSSGCSGSPTAR
ncbi:hypothetical protein EYF80_037279 [Liparis tanakae]|uniref:Uncharacterized protein n=1 Tax=Liparis tanakae TaxID=230148 RepID=A0A4Z2GII3_9TELE|nr:hypothetical protein EYF80_037279 [Liparis tanakae]